MKIAIEWLASVAMATLMLAFLGWLLMIQGCGFEGDTYSGVVTQVDCGSASTTTGQLQCGSGTQSDDHHSEELMVEEE